LTWDWPF
jgi:hypothetical protein